LIGFDFLSANVAVQGDVDVVNGPSVQSSAMLTTKYVNIGGEFLCNTHLEDKRKGMELIDLNVGILINGPDWKTSFRTANLFCNYRVGFICNISNTVDLGAQVNYRIDNSHQSVMIGAKWMYVE
jgi:hypothetical protein